ncbi:MAG: transposase [Patescibacteria group bacterium]
MLVINYVEVFTRNQVVTASSTTGVCFDKKVTVKNMGRYRLIIQDGQIFLSNDFASSAGQVIAKYRQRWVIDENYRKMKDKLNLEGFQMRKPASILRHLYLVFLAFTFFVWAKTKHIFSKVFAGAIDTVSDLCQVVRNLSVYQRAKMQINDLLSLLQLKPNFQV